MLACLAACYAVTRPRNASSLSQASPQAPSSALFNPNPRASKGFQWAATGLAVLTAFAQGLVTALINMTESSNSWTFRFRLAKVEHWWWTMVTILLTISLVLDVLSFASGNSNDAVSILVIALTTFLSLVRYLLPAWRSRHFLRNRWLAWAGPSRTAILRNTKAYCGGKRDWKKLASSVKDAPGNALPSDNYGWHLLPLTGIRRNPTDILNAVNTQTLPALSGETTFIYDDGQEDSETVSLLWGPFLGFVPQVSRSVSSVPTGLLKSQPDTTEGYAGEGFALGLGILGRNKGLRPKELVFNMTGRVSISLEQRSTWRPRPAKTLRSYYHRTLEAIFGGLGESYVLAAVELCLLLMDADHHAVTEWLKAACEHQSYQINQELVKLGATAQELDAHYRSSYVSMIMSLNSMKDKLLGYRNHLSSQAKRPDLICLGLLLLAEGKPKPLWWNMPVIDAYRRAEKEHLDGDWYDGAARLLGLESFRYGLEDGGWEGQKVPVKEAEFEKGAPQGSR